jgi:hypothetical protein
VYQTRYWNLLKELKAQVEYLHGYAARDEFYDKAVNVFLGLTSSVSIAGWAIWTEYQLVWACIIAASQVVTAIKPFFPFNQRLNVVSELNNHIQSIFLETERGWFKVSEGQLSEEEIHNETVKLKDRVLSAERASLNGVILPRKLDLKKNSEAYADEYFTINYLS